MSAFSFTPYPSTDGLKAAFYFFYFVEIPLLIWFLYMIFTGRFGKIKSDEKGNNVVRFIGGINAVILLNIPAVKDGAGVIGLLLFCTILVLSFVFYKLSRRKKQSDRI